MINAQITHGLNPVKNRSLLRSHYLQDTCLHAHRNLSLSSGTLPPLFLSQDRIACFSMLNLQSCSSWDLCALPYLED